MHVGDVGRGDRGKTRSWTSVILRHRVDERTQAYRALSLHMLPHSAQGLQKESPTGGVLRHTRSIEIGRKKERKVGIPVD